MKRHLGQEAKKDGHFCRLTSLSLVIISILSLARRRESQKFPGSTVILVLGFQSSHCKVSYVVHIYVEDTLVKHSKFI